MTDCRNCKNKIICFFARERIQDLNDYDIGQKKKDNKLYKEKNYENWKNWENIKRNKKFCE